VGASAEEARGTLCVFYRRWEEGSGRGGSESAGGGALLQCFQCSMVSGGEQRGWCPIA
jgi:hypothetical protein